MTNNQKWAQFKAKVLRPADAGEGDEWAFVVLPADVSSSLSRRGRLTVRAKINGVEFQVQLEPDGQKSHWLKIDQSILQESAADSGDVAEFSIAALAQEPEPDVPDDLIRALKGSPEASVIWKATTTIARVDWIHWITSAKQAKTRTKRVSDALDMLASGKKRVCCFDPSGFYSKAFCAPKVAE